VIGLAEFQRGFRHTLLEGMAEEAPGMAVYRDNLFGSLTRVLADTFPAVERLVDARFFAYAAHEFIGAHLPRHPCLFAYGRDFPDFLGGFPATRDLRYVKDVARLEWLMNEALHAPDRPALEPARLADIAPEEAPRLTFTLHPALGFLASPWPIDRLWRANRRGTTESQAIDLDGGGVWLQVGRGTEVELRSLTPAGFAFRELLSRGADLEAASEAALHIEPAFDITREFTALFAEGAVTGFHLPEKDIA